MKSNNLPKNLEYSLNDLVKKYKIVLGNHNDHHLLAVFDMYLQGFSKLEIGKRFKVSKEKVRQYIYTCIRKMNCNRNFMDTINLAKKEIFKFIDFDKRYIRLPIESVNLIADFSKDFVKSGTYLYDKKYREYILESFLSKGFIKISQFFYENDFDESIFIRTKVKGILNGYAIKSIEGYLRYKSQISDTIVISEIVNEFHIVFKQNNKRTIGARLERYNNFLIKVSRDKFIFKTKDIVSKFKNEIFVNLKKAVYEDSIYSFARIKENLLKNNIDLSFFPGDSIYYLVKEMHFEDFNFSKKNSKLIYPKEKEVLSVSEILKKFFPAGMGILNLDKLIDLGFSKTIIINNDEIWNNLYFSKKRQRNLIINFQDILSSEKHIYYYDDLLKKAKEELLLYLKNTNVLTKLKVFTDNYFLLEHTFIKLSKEYEEYEYQEIISLIAEYAINKINNEDYTHSDSSLYNRFKEFFDKNDKHYEDVLKSIYKKRIMKERKDRVKEYFIWKRNQ